MSLSKMSDVNPDYVLLHHPKHLPISPENSIRIRPNMHITRRQQPGRQQLRAHRPYALQQRRRTLPYATTYPLIAKNTAKQQRHRLNHTQKINQPGELRRDMHRHF